VNKKWSQATLANKIETDQKRISKIETGNVYIGWDTFYKISQALDVSIEELIEGDE
jgi:transcriptional regulator with XRE-family HTH domain